jgi:hypothetical protein
MIVRCQSGAAAGCAAVFADDRLSIEAKGLLAYLLSRPLGWTCHVEDIGNALWTRRGHRVGREMLHELFRELVAAKYAEIRRPRSSGEYTFGEYIISLPGPGER